MAFESIRVRLPASYPHVSQLFHLLGARCSTGVGAGGSSGESCTLFDVAVANLNDFFHIGHPEHRLTPQFIEFSNECSDPHNLLVIDGSTEGWPFVPQVFEVFHGHLHNLGIDARRVVIVSTNHVLPQSYNAWARAKGVQPLNFVIYDYWCYRMATELLAGGQHAAGGPQTFVPSFAVESKLLCLNREPKAHRAAVILQMIANGEFERCRLSFMPDRADVPADEINRLQQQFRQLGWPALTALLDAYWPELARRIPIVLDEGATTQYLSFVFGGTLSPEYDRVGFAVITESDFGVANVDRVTEKPFKAIANRCPFIMAGQPQQLARMSKLGFEPFPMFDNSYDEIDDPNRRLAAVLAEIDRLSRLSCEELHRQRLLMHDIAVRNLRHLLHYGEPFMLDALAGTIGYQLAAHARLAVPARS